MQAHDPIRSGQYPIPQSPMPVELQSQRHHVHHSYIWLGGLGASFWCVFVVAISVIGSVDSVLQDEPLAASFVFSHMILWVAAAAVLVAMIVGACFGIRALMYKNLYYELSESELGVYSGIISKKRIHVPYQKIQSVDLKAQLIPRLFGLCNVVIDTAGGASNKAVIIPYLQKGVAESLRNQLYSLKSQAISSTSAYAETSHGAESNIFDIGDSAWREFGGVFAGEECSQRPSFQYGLTNKEIFLTAISNSGGVMGGILGSVIVALLGLAPVLVGVMDNVVEAYVLDGAPIPQGDMGTQALDSLALNVLSAIAPFVAVGTLVLAIAIWAIASLGVCIQFGGFKARRCGTRIEVEHGLLQHNATSLDIERVQSINIRQTFIRRLIGYCEISLGKVNAVEASTSQARSEAKSMSQSGFVIHPFVKVDKVGEILHGMVPEYANLPVKETRVAPVALRRGLVRRCIWQGGGFWITVATAIAQALVHVGFELGISTDPIAEGIDLDMGLLGAFDVIAGILYALAAVVLAIDICSTVLWYRDSRFGKDDRSVSLTNGGLSKDIAVLPKKKIQYGGKRANPLQRLARTATINARTAAGVGGTGSSLIDVPVEVADAWLEWLEPRPHAAPSCQFSPSPKDMPSNSSKSGSQSTPSASDQAAS